VGGFVWVRLFSSGVGLGLMNMCNCSGAYPQYYNSYSSYQGYGGMYPQSYPQYSSYQGYGGGYPQYYPQSYPQSYPQYYNNYSPYQGYSGTYPQSYPQYSSFEGYGGMYPQYNNYSMGQFAGMMAYPVSGCGCGHSLPSGSTRGEYRAGSCLIICNR